MDGLDYAGTRGGSKGALYLFPDEFEVEQTEAEGDPIQADAGEVEQAVTPAAEAEQPENAPEGAPPAQDGERSLWNKAKAALRASG